MTRKPIRVAIGDEVRHRVVLTDDPSSGPSIVRRQYQFLEELIGPGMAQGFLHCGPVPFQKMVMYHDGAAWIVELEAIETL